MKSGRIAVAVMILLLTVSLYAWMEGNRCLGLWSDGYWYPATVVKAEAGVYFVAFDDGDSASVNESGIRAIDWRIGTYIQCNWKRKGAYYPGRITAMIGESIHVSYDDGDEEDTSIGMCRSRP